MYCTRMIAALFVSALANLNPDARPARVPERGTIAGTLAGVAAIGPLLLFALSVFADSPTPGQDSQGEGSQLPQLLPSRATQPENTPHRIKGKETPTILKVGSHRIPPRPVKEARLQTGTLRFPVGIAAVLRAQNRYLAFVPNPHHGVDAVDLASGETLWSTHEAQVPLFVHARHLHAQAGTKRNRIRILAFDLDRKGFCALESDPVVLPRWAVTGKARGRSFRGRWYLHQADLLLRWEAEAWAKPQGKTRSRLPEVGLLPHKRAEGLARVDLFTGEVQNLPLVGNWRTLVANPKPEHPWASGVSSLLEKRAVRWQGEVSGYYVALVVEYQQPPSKPQRFGPIGFGRRRFATNPKQVVKLYSWEPATGRMVANMPLKRGRRLEVRTTIDEQFFCIRDANPSPDLLTRKTKKMGQWSIYSRKGTHMGDVPYIPGTEKIALINGQVYFLVAGSLFGAAPERRRLFLTLNTKSDPLGKPKVRSRTLQAFDISSGEKQWQRDVAGKLLTPPQ